MPHSLFLKKLRHGAQLTPGDEANLIALLRNDQTIEARTDFLSQGDTPVALPVIVDGWVLRYRLLQNGKRQVVNVLLPGDLSEPFGVLPRFMDFTLTAATPLRFASIPLDALNKAAQASSRINQALWWDLLLTWAIERERIVSLGRRSALERLAHLFCEFHFRLGLVGLVDGDSYDMPLTQSELCDLLGLSTVHVNRTLQELRRLKLISLRGRSIKLQDPEQLRELAHYDEINMSVGAPLQSIT